MQSKMWVHLVQIGYCNILGKWNKKTTAIGEIPLDIQTGRKKPTEKYQKGSKCDKME